MLVRNNGWANLLSLLYIRHYSVSVANHVIYSRDHSQLTGTIFGKMVVMAPNRLNLGKRKSFTVRNPGKIRNRALFALFRGLAEDIWEGRDGRMDRHNRSFPPQ